MGRASCFASLSLTYSLFLLACQPLLFDQPAGYRPGGLFFSRLGNRSTFRAAHPGLRPRRRQRHRCLMAASAPHYSGDSGSRRLDLGAHVGLALPWPGRLEAARQAIIGKVVGASLAHQIAGVDAGMIEAGHQTSPMIKASRNAMAVRLTRRAAVAVIAPPPWPPPLAGRRGMRRGLRAGRSSCRHSYAR